MVFHELLSERRQEKEGKEEIKEERLSNSPRNLKDGEFPKQSWSHLKRSMAFIFVAKTTLPPRPHPEFPPRKIYAVDACEYNF